MRGPTTLMGASSCLLLGLALAQATGQVAKPPQGWTADAAASKQLGAAVAVEDYTLQIPKGYASQAITSPAGMKMWGWAGEARKDGTKPALSLYRHMFPAAEREKIKALTVERLAEKLIGAGTRRRMGWKQEKTEKGRINGLDFARIRWEGADPSRKSIMRGVLYVMRDGETIIQITSQDMMPEADKSLPIAEAAVFSFRKK